MCGDRETETETERWIDFKELAHRIVQAAKSEIRADWQARVLQFKSESEGSLEAQFLLP